MSVREEDRRKNNCSNRGVGLAAAAIGVGVGAALYYFFSKRPENPDSEGSTSQDWAVEEPQTLDISVESIQSGYTTISVHTTTDTSVHDSSNDFIMEDSDDVNESDIILISSESDDEYDSDLEVNDIYSYSSSSQDDEWDVTNSSADIPSFSITEILRPVREKETREQEQARILRQQNFRERKWSLEECAICFDVMLKEQQLMALPCTHHFHVACIGPWLQEHQTCPVCRMAAE